jgi:hypothetical protein
MNRCASIVVLAILLSMSPEAFAQDATTGGEAPAFNALDRFWIIFAAVLVFFMQAGFGLVEAGQVRAKNADNILLKNRMDYSPAALPFLAVDVASDLRVSRRAELRDLDVHDHGMELYVDLQIFVTDLFDCVELGTRARGINVL